MLWATLTSLASLASIVGVVLQLWKHKERPKTYGLLVVALLMSALTGILWTQNASLREQNLELRSARQQAADLVQKWPKADSLTFVSPGELRGVVLSGLAFLETNKALSPETYAATRKLLLEELT